jgi:serine/threonine protein kinase
MTFMNLSPGEVATILDRHGYDFISPLNHGSQGSVYLCRCRRDSVEYAVKLSCAASIFHEFEVLKSTCNVNIIYMYDSFVESDYRFIVLEYCSGGSLADKLAAGPLSQDELCSYCAQLVSALRACHAVRVAHSDLKPQNVLISRQGRLKLADFGLASIHESQTSSQFKGSLAYVAPEVLRHKAFDPFKADVWSLGVTFYVMATGRLPWPENLRPHEFYDCIVQGLPAFSDAIPRELAILLPKMVVADPNARLKIDQVDPLAFCAPPTVALSSKRWSGDGIKPARPMTRIRSRASLGDGLVPPPSSRRLKISTSRSRSETRGLPALS